MGARDSAPHVQLDERAAWRRWLEANHATARGVWLVSWRSASGNRRLDYESAIEEALCFGWIDGQAGSVDAQRSKLYFAPRRPKSRWSERNKARFARMLAAGQVAPAGMAAVERAKANGGWTVVDGA